MNAPAKPLTIAIQPVKSTNVSGIGYDAPSGTLEVHFANGGKYRYTGVTQEVFDGFLKAPSPGGYFASVVRGKFPGTNLNARPDPGAVSMDPQRQREAIPRQD